eukprot:TRINITY_DN69762_c0_g1_i1.p1 TRINITY_DN69762_c0_g1~~TRINITY_DN69762_c0_g1_i1.p1  ORF type:complete len:386 (-),score=78.37 TRINITY_DN69762_c0_g1_i1:115-1272(-)
MAMDSDVVELLAMYGGLLSDENKDVTFKLADGEEHAHKNILMAASEVFAGMFKQGMREKQEGVIELPDVSRIAMKVFLRLLYTGHVDPADWASSGQLEKATNMKMNTLRVMSQSGVTAQGQEFTAQQDRWSSAVVLDAGEGDWELMVRSESWGRNFMIGTTSASCTAGTCMYRGQGIFVHVYANKARTVLENGAYRPLHAGPEIANNTDVSFKYRHATSEFSISVDGEPVERFDVNAKLPDVTRCCPAINFYEEGASLTATLKSSSPGGPKCPDDVLIAVAQLSKKYMVKRLVSKVTQVLKRRLTDARNNASVEQFQRLLSAAISMDLGALRMAALEDAKAFTKLREQYDAEALQPEVMFELEAIWPSPPAGKQPAKRARLHALA